MMSSIVLTVTGVEQAVAKLGAVLTMTHMELAEGLGALGQSQTQRRIEAEKTAPDGKPWAKTRDGRGALFRTGAHLYDSIDYKASGMNAIWGSGWPLAVVHQEGREIRAKKGKALRFVAGGATHFRAKVSIPARPFIGLSADNADEMEKTAIDFIERVL